MRLKMTKNMLKGMIKHFILVSKHKWLVFKFSIKLGIPIRGLLHDLSKFSIEEFGESMKYYDGKLSAIVVAKRKNGFSRAWLHHKGRNKHHEWYWVDLDSEEVAPVIPYKYVAEMICDKLSASITYGGKDWTTSSEYDYWMKERQKVIVNPKIDNFFCAVFTQVKDFGIDKTLNKKNIKDLYKKYCIDDKRIYKYEFHGSWKEI